MKKKHVKVFDNLFYRKGYRSGYKNGYNLAISEIDAFRDISISDNDFIIKVLKMRKK